MECENRQMDLIEYACEKFQMHCYEEALEAFVLAYTKGIACEWVLENIYNCYVSGNEEQFRETYERQAHGIPCAYDECTLDFVPYRDGEYFIFDKEQMIFRGVFSVRDLDAVQPNELFERMPFSAAALAFDWNWNQIRDILAEAKNRKIYAVCHDIQRSASFLKIEELSAYMKNIMMFPDYEKFQNYFHENTGVYLPMLIFGNEAGKQELAEIREEEHRYRLTQEGRNRDHVLLTIAIPTAHRGNLVLERMRNLLPMQYDAEVEFAISKNGTQWYQEEYKKVSEIPDARIEYYDHNRDLRPEENWHYAVDMSHGKYVLFVSDEDDVVVDSIDYYLKLLSTNPDVNQVRAKTMYQYANIEKKAYGKKGIEAFDLVFLRQNYLSGLIVRRNDFIQQNFRELSRFMNNEFYRNYAHEWWCALLSQTGDAIEDPTVLVADDEPVIDQIRLRSYAIYEQRLKQFQGQIDFLRWFMGNNREGMRIGLGKSISKVDYLLQITRRLDSDAEKYEKFLDQFLWMCIDAIDNSGLLEEQKIHLLQWTQKLGTESLEWNEEMKKSKDANHETI